MSTIEITSDNLDATLDKGGIVLLDFWAGWCAPCRTFAPTFEAAAQKHPDIIFGKVDTEAQQQLAREFEIRSIPTVAAFRDGIGVVVQPGVLVPLGLEALIAHVRGLDMEALRKKMDEEQVPSFDEE